MAIPTEPIGSIPRPPELIRAAQQGLLDKGRLDELYQQALVDTIQRFEATGSPIITDGEQTKPSFATYPIHGQPAAWALSRQRYAAYTTVDAVCSRENTAYTAPDAACTTADTACSMINTACTSEYAACTAIDTAYAM